MPLRGREPRGLLAGWTLCDCTSNPQVRSLAGAREYDHLKRPAEDEGVVQVALTQVLAERWWKPHIVVCEFILCIDGLKFLRALFWIIRRRKSKWTEDFLPEYNSVMDRWMQFGSS